MLSFKKPRSTGWIIHKNVNYTTLANVDGVLFMLAGEKGAQKIIAYAKTFDDGTIIYFEEIVNSKKHPNSLVSKTFYKRKKPVTPDKFRNIVAGNRTDVSNGRIIAGSGGHPSNKTGNSPPATNSDMPHNTPSLSPDSPDESSGISEPVVNIFFRCCPV